MAMRTGSRGSITERSLPLTLSDSVTQSKSMRFSVHTGSTSTCSKPCSSVSTKTRWRCAKGARQLSGLDHYAPNRHDTGSTTARSVDEVALIRDTISHYAPVLIAHLAGLDPLIFSGRRKARSLQLQTCRGRDTSPKRLPRNYAKLTFWSREVRALPMRPVRLG